MDSTAVSFAIILWLFFMAAGTVMYFLPTIVAIMQHRNNVGTIAVINTLLGWSCVGWVIALIMAVTKDAQPVQVVHVQQNMGYMPGGYPQPQSSYTRGRPVPGSDIEVIDEQAAPGSELQRPPD